MVDFFVLPYRALDQQGLELLAVGMPVELLIAFAELCELVFEELAALQQIRFFFLQTFQALIIVAKGKVCGA
jgi:hypothetical protein